MKIKPFLIISLIARSPGMMCSIAIGRQIMHGNYHSAIIIAVIVVILFIIGVLFRDKVFKFFDVVYDKLIQM